MVHEKPAWWQARCAEAIGDVVREESISVLQKILFSGHEEAVAIAANALADENVELPDVSHDPLLALLESMPRRNPEVSADIAKLLRLIQRSEE